MARRTFRVPFRVYIRLALYLGACWTMVGVLLHGVVPYAAVATVALALYTTFPLALFLRFGGFPFYPGRAFRLLFVRPFWYAQPVLLLVTAFGLVGLVVGLPFGNSVVGARIAGGSIATVMILLYIVAYVGASRLATRRIDAFIPTLPSEFDGVTIAQVSDLHVGPHTSQRFLRRVRESLNALAPDIIAVIGDLVDDRHEDLAVYEAAFGSLAAPLGVFVVPGNHDVYAGWELVRDALRRGTTGRLLLNENVLLHKDGAVLYLAGTGDPAGGAMHASDAAPDLPRALSGIPPGAAVVALAHNPALWPALAERGVALTLSGHTHWGQFAFPRFGWSLASPFLEQAMGAHQHGESLLYIGPGTGYWGIPFRIGASSEISLVRLRKGPAALISS